MSNYQRAPQDPYYPPPSYAPPYAPPSSYPPPGYPSAPLQPPPGYASYPPPPPPHYQGYQGYFNQGYSPPPPPNYHCHDVQHHQNDNPDFTSFLQGCILLLLFARGVLLFLIIILKDVSAVWCTWLVIALRINVALIVLLDMCGTWQVLVILVTPGFYRCPHSSLGCS